MCVYASTCVCIWIRNGVILVSCTRSPLIDLDLSFIYVALDLTAIDTLRKQTVARISWPFISGLNLTRNWFSSLLTFSLFSWSGFGTWPSSASSQIWIQSLLLRTHLSPSVAEGAVQTPPLHSLFPSHLKFSSLLLFLLLGNLCLKFLVHLP